ncbi:MAG: TOBE domain-containing protein [Rhodospirillales bacterium]|nr:TOBE domain-containing protein [Rhodospirillales bacterium]
MSDGKIEAILSLKGSSPAQVGRDRILLLEAVGVHGSITKAAHAVGLSYKAAWDAINAVNNLLPRPAVSAQTGGRHGGGAVVTEDGKALIVSFHLLEERLSRATDLLASAPGPIDPLTLLRSLGMRTSARNAFRCTVSEIRKGAVNSEVVLKLADNVSLAAIITGESVRNLDIEIGKSVTALVKASFVMLATGSNEPQVSARNRIPGTVSHREDGPVNSEITLDIGEAKSLTAIVTKQSAEQLNLAPGAAAWALFKASHVILAVD